VYSEAGSWKKIELRRVRAQSDLHTYVCKLVRSAIYVNNLARLRNAVIQPSDFWMLVRLLYVHVFGQKVINWSFTIRAALDSSPLA
jgi:hypothetical protein